MITDVGVLILMVLFSVVFWQASSNLYRAATDKTERIGATHGCGAYEVDPLTGKTKFVWNDNGKDSTLSTGAR